MRNDIAITGHDTTTAMPPVPTQIEGVPFHRLARSASTHRWWRPILVGIIAVLFYAVAFLLIMIIVGVGSAVSPRIESAMAVLLQEGTEFDLGDPISFVVAMMMLILLIPSLWVATMIAGARPTGMLMSVVGRLRWGWFTTCAMVAVVVYAVAYCFSFLMAVAQGESLASAFDPTGALLLLALTFALVPLQCLAEELVFRGYLMQAIGTWLRHPAFAILLPVPFFVIGHEYGPLGMTDVAVFAIAAGYLTWRTGGLEAAFAIHVVGNVSTFALAAIGLVDINATEVSIPSLVLSLLTTLTFTVVVLRLAQSRSVQRTAKPISSLTTFPSAGRAPHQFAA